MLLSKWKKNNNKVRILVSQWLHFWECISFMMQELMTVGLWGGETAYVAIFGSWPLSHNSVSQGLFSDAALWNLCGVPLWCLKYQWKCPCKLHGHPDVLNMSLVLQQGAKQELYSQLVCCEEKVTTLLPLGNIYSSVKVVFIFFLIFSVHI